MVKENINEEQNLKNRLKLLSGKVSWVSIMYRHRNWKKDNEFRELCRVCYVCVCISDEAISLEFSQ